MHTVLFLIQNQRLFSYYFKFKQLYLNCVLRTLLKWIKKKNLYWLLITTHIKNISAIRW